MTDYICGTVRELLLKWEERDPFRLAQRMDIEILTLPLGEHLKGYFLYLSRVAVIVINDSISAELQRVVCAHELGHAVLHKEIAMNSRFQELSLFDNSVRTESEATLFAAELLIPDEELLMLLREDQTVFEAASCLSVPVDLVNVKLQLLRKKGVALCIPMESTGDFLKSDRLI